MGSLMMLYLARIGMGLGRRCLSVGIQFGNPLVSRWRNREGHCLQRQRHSHRYRICADRNADRDLPWLGVGVLPVWVGGCALVAWRYIVSTRLKIIRASLQQNWIYQP